MDKNPLPRIIDKHELSLRAASDEDYAYLQSWFTNKREVLLWAGPSLPFPLANDAFIEYLLSSHYFSYAMHSNSHLIGFGQYQLHKNHMHLGRLAINPKCRKQGLSYTLVNKLIAMGTEQSPEVIKTVSLFVFKTNKIATTAYVNLGFVACRLPTGIKPVEGCQYMLMFL